MGQAPDELSGSGRANERRDPAATVPPLTSTGTRGLSGAFDDATTMDMGAQDAADEPEIIAVEIEQTRIEMGETIDEIQERLSPERLKDEALNRAKEATIGKAQHAVEQTIGKAQQMMGGGGSAGQQTSLMATIKENPLPAAMVGIGLGMLWKQRSKSSVHQQSRNYMGQPGMYGYPQRQGNLYSPYGATTETQPDGGLGETMSNAGDTAMHAAGKVGDMATGAVVGAAGVMADATGGAISGVEQMGSTVQSQAQHMLSSYQQLLRERPMLAGAIALGVGAAVGMLLPETQQEQEMLGPARDTMVDKAQDAAQQAMDKAQDVVQSVQSTMQETGSSAQHSG